ncbi:MAG TPA: methyl-accepting chemotaxis protein [Myxococcales bacterium]|nr:methyl-accepting chemotaxis protein [Myxococcales bacterium]
MGASAEGTRRRPLTLATKIVLLSVGVSLALAVGLTSLGYRKAASGLRSKSELALDSESLLTAILVENWVSERLTALRGVADLRSVRTVLDTAVSLAREDVDATNQALADVASVAPEIESIEVIDLQGAVVAGTTDEKDPRPLAQQREVQMALSGKDFLSGVAVSPASGKPCMYTAVPARGSNGTVVGVVRARESIDRIQALVAAARVRIGPGAQGVLLDGDGLVVATTADPSWRLRPVTPLGLAREEAMRNEGRWGKRSPPEAIGALELAAVRGIPSHRVFSWTLSGVRHVAVAEPLQKAGWTYAAALPVAEVEAEARSFLRQAVTGAVVGLLAAAALSLLVARRVVQAIRRLTAVSQRIVAENDLTQRVEASSGDEVGQLAESFSRMVDALRTALTTLQSSSATLLQAAEQLRSTTEGERELLGRQASALQQTQVTAQEIKQTSALAAEKANAVLRAAEGAGEMGRSGETAVEESITGLASIRAQTSEIGEHIRTLGGSARQIGGITATVKDLADQSNMLALNAAIEAVRSGEHGKGFAVVAREIRSLADQSIAATRRVGEILDSLGASIQSAVKMSEHGAQAIGDGLTRVKQSGDNLRGLLAITRENVDSARQIAAAVGQQDAGIQQIFVAVTDQLAMMQQTQQRLEITTAASAAVREQAARVSELLARYLI